MATYVSHEYNANATSFNNAIFGSMFGASNTSTDGTVSVIVIGDNASGNIGEYSNDGYGLYITRDSGTTWALVKMPNTTIAYSGIAAGTDISNRSHGGFSMSKDGKYMCCCVTYVPGNKSQKCFVYYSKDKGFTWTQCNIPANSTGTVIGLSTVSDDGKYIFIATYENNVIWTSNNYGVNWFTVPTDNRVFPNMQAVCSTNGEKLFRGIHRDNNKHYYYSTNYGTTYTQLGPNQTYVAYNMCANDDMTKIIVLHDIVNVVTMFSGTDLSVTGNWTTYTTFSTRFTDSTYAPRYSICSSSDLKYVVMQCTSTKFVFSNDYGVTWTPFDLTVAATTTLYSMSMSNSGKLTYMKSDKQAIITVQLYQLLHSKTMNIDIKDVLSAGENLTSLLSNDWYNVTDSINANIAVTALLATGLFTFSSETTETFTDNELSATGSFVGDNNTEKKAIKHTFQLPAENQITNMKVTVFTGTGTIAYSLTTDGKTDINGTFNSTTATDANLLDANILTLVDKTYTLSLISAANSNLGYTINVSKEELDLTPPSMTITAAGDNNIPVDNNTTTRDSSITLTFTSSESTTDFVETDISYTNGSLSNFAGSGSIYTATFTPSHQGACTIRVIAGKYADAAGNFNTESETFTWTFYGDTNRFDQTYVRGFVDVSGGVNIRNDSNLIVNGNYKVDGNFVTAPGTSTNIINRTVQSNLFTNSDISINGNLYLGGDLSVNGQFSSNFANGIIPNSAIYYVDNNTITGNVSMGDVSFNGISKTVELSETTTLQTTGTITFSNGSQLNSYNDNILSGSYVHGNVLFKDSTFSEVTVNGNVYVGATTYTSDYRIKTDVTTLDGSFTVDALNPVQYNNILTKGHEYGLIAHELQEVYPDMVIGEKDGEKYQSVMYTNLISVMVKEVQELKHRMNLLDSV